MITTAIFLRFPIIPREYLILGSSNMHNREESRIIGEERTVSSAINNSLEAVPASKLFARNRILLRTKLIPRRSPPPRPTLFRIIEEKGWNNRNRLRLGTGRATLFQTATSASNLNVNRAAGLVYEPLGRGGGSVIGARAPWPLRGNFETRKGKEEPIRGRSHRRSSFD